ncbi:hypothetical protein [Endozoicomonas acroporae]|uniref:hypothetical protein n=1 Tax=Endozoicomonas acroporae TaxID=1701104 RepID=UPI003D7BC32F
MTPSTSVQLSWLENIQYNYQTEGLWSALFAVFCFAGHSRTISVVEAENYINAYPESGLTQALNRKIASRKVTLSPAGDLRAQTTTLRPDPKDTQTPIAQEAGRSNSQSEVNTGQLSEQQRLGQLQENMKELAKLATKYVDIVREVSDIPMSIVFIGPELSAIENGEKTLSAKQIISDLRAWSKELKFGFDSIMDSSQTITDESAAQALKQFRSRFDKLERILERKQDAGHILGSTLDGAAGLLPDIKSNITAYQVTECISNAENRVITSAEKLQKIINDGHEVLDNVLSVTQGNKDYQELKQQLDSRIQNILDMQGNKHS